MKFHDVSLKLCWDPYHFHILRHTFTKLWSFLFVPCPTLEVSWRGLVCFAMCKVCGLRCGWGPLGHRRARRRSATLWPWHRHHRHRCVRGAARCPSNGPWPRYGRAKWARPTGPGHCEGARDHWSRWNRSRHGAGPWAIWRNTWDWRRWNSWDLPGGPHWPHPVASRVSKLRHPRHRCLTCLTCLLSREPREDNPLARMGHVLIAICGSWKPFSLLRSPRGCHFWSLVVSVGSVETVDFESFLLGSTTGCKARFNERLQNLKVSGSSHQWGLSLAFLLGNLRSVWKPSRLYGLQLAGSWSQRWCLHPEFGPQHVRI